MKIVTISKVGYNAPRSANWAYGVWKIDMLDSDKEYCHSITVKENFGGDSRLKNIMREKGYKLIEVRGVYTGTGAPSLTGMSTLKDMESDEVINEVIDFLK